MKKIRVAIFEDNPDRLDSLQMLIESKEDLQLAGSAINAHNALEEVAVWLPDVVLMDIGMPGVSGIVATRVIKEKYPQISILIQTVFEDSEKIFDSIKAGASGYILKKASSEKIIEAIFDVYNGGSPITPSIAGKVLSYFQSEPTPVKNDIYNLTDREEQVLQFLVTGDSYKMIADKMNISYFTVNSHIKKIYSKLHVNSIGEAISKALKDNIV